MNAVAKRKKIHAYLDKADDNFVEIVYQLVTYNEKSSSEKSLLTDQQKKELDKTLRDYESGKEKLYTFNEVKASILRKRKK
jgi:hypothetical protein